MANEIELDKLIAKATTDSAFRAALLKSPKAALKKAFDLELPGQKIKVLEDSAKVVHLVVPLPPEKDEAFPTEPDPNYTGKYWP